jgi:hypothetical protein
MALALGKLTTGTPKFRGSGFVGMHVKSITAQEKFNFPRANAILTRAQALLWVRDRIRGGMRVFPKCNARISAAHYYSSYLFSTRRSIKTVEIYCDFCCEDLVFSKVCFDNLFV